MSLAILHWQRSLVGGGLADFARSLLRGWIIAFTSELYVNVHAVQHGCRVDCLVCWSLPWRVENANSGLAVLVL